MLRRYVAFVVRWPRSIIALVLGLSLVLGAFVHRIQLVLDVDAQIPPGHPLVVVGKQIEHSFGGKFFTVVGVYPKSGTIYSPDVLAKVKRINDAIEKLPGIRPGSVLSLMSSRIKDVHSTEDSLEIAPLASSVPHTKAEVAAFRERVQRNRTITSLLVSDDGKATAVLLDLEDFAKAGGADEFYDRLEGILAPERSSDVEIVAAGAPTLLHWLLVYTRRVAVLFLVALAMIGYLHYRAFRTLQGMFIPLVTALLGVVWALGFMGIIGAPMDPWNIMTPILLLAIGAGHSVQILKRYYEEYARLGEQGAPVALRDRNRAAVVEATSKVGAVMLAAGAIASLSFASLATFGLPSIQSFGLCTAIGIVAALAIEMTFIPALRVLLPAPSSHQTAREREAESFDPLLEGLAARVSKGSERRVALVFAAICLLAVAGAPRLNAGNSMGAQFFEVNAPVRGFRLADAKLAGTRVIQVLVQGEAPDAIKSPKVLHAMDELASFIRHQPLPIGNVVSIVDVFKQMDRAIAGPHAGAPKLPASSEAAAQYLLLYSMSGDEDDLSRLVDHDYQRTVLTAYVRTDDYSDLQGMTLRVQSEANRLFAHTGASATVGGGMTSAIALNETMVHGKTMNLIQISLLVLVITSLLMRSLLAGALVLLPLATAALVNLGLMGWLGIPLSMGTAAISAMAVGIGADYAVYFLFRVREEFGRCGDLRAANAAALVTSGKAIAYVASAVAGGYLCLALSGFKMHVLLGLLVALTMVISSLATLVLLPAVIVGLQPSFLVKRTATTAVDPSPAPAAP